MEFKKSRDSQSAFSRSSKVLALHCNMVLCIFSTDGHSPTEFLAPSLTEFLDHKTTASAYEYLQEKLCDCKVANWNSVYGNIYACHQLFFIAKIKKVPGNLTVFAFPQSVIYSSSDICQLYMQMENKSMYDERCRTLAKQKLYCPKTVNNRNHILNAFSAVNAIFLVDDNLATFELVSMINYMNEHNHIYEYWQQDESSFMNQILCSIDQGWQRFILKARERVVNFATLDFISITREIKKSSFSIKLPHELKSILHKPDRKRKFSDSHPLAPSPESRNLSAISNPIPNLSWILRCE